MTLATPRTATRQLIEFAVSSTGTILTSTISGGTQSNFITPEAGYPGQQTITVDNLNDRFFWTSNIAALLIGGGEIICECVLGLTTALSSAAEEYQVVACLGDVNTAIAQTDGIYFLYDRTVSANWQCVTAAGGVRTTQDSLFPVATGTLVRLTVRLNSNATLAYFYINGNLVKTTSTNLPTAAQYVGLLIGMLKSVATAAAVRSIRVDYIYFQQTFSTSR